MNPIFEFSAAPHLPYALRTAQAHAPRPEAIASVIMLAAQGSNDVQITERGGELFIVFASGI